MCILRLIGEKPRARLFEGAKAPDPANAADTSSLAFTALTLGQKIVAYAVVSLRYVRSTTRANMIHTKHGVLASYRMVTFNNSARRWTGRSFVWIYLQGCLLLNQETLDGPPCDPSMYIFER